VLPLGEFTVTIPEPRATLQGVRIPSAILKIVFAIFFCFLCSLGFDERWLSYRLRYTCLLQQAQLSLRVIEYFAKSRSFEITTLSRACVSPICIFHWNYICISYHFWDIQCQKNGMTLTPKNGKNGAVR